MKGKGDSACLLSCSIRALTMISKSVPRPRVFVSFARSFIDKRSYDVFGFDTFVLLLDMSLVEVIVPLVGLMAIVLFGWTMFEVTIAPFMVLKTACCLNLSFPEREVLWHQTMFV